MDTVQDWVCRSLISRRPQALQTAAAPATQAQRRRPGKLLRHHQVRLCAKRDPCGDVLGACALQLADSQQLSPRAGVMVAAGIMGAFRVFGGMLGFGKKEGSKGSRAGEAGKGDDAGPDPDDDECQKK